LSEIKRHSARIHAAALVAQEKLTEVEIAKKVGVSRRSLQNWKTEPEFQAEVRKHYDAWRDHLMERGVASKERRLYRLNDRWRRLQTVIDERAKDPRFQNVAGGKTGALCYTVKTVGSGTDARVVPIYEVDVGLFREIREIEAQAAQELGHWERDQRNIGSPVVLVVSQAAAPASSDRVIDVAAALLQAPQQEPRKMPGVVIDLVPGQS
jgi:hypothetical protein